jgi:hypothetical protein
VSTPSPTICSLHPSATEIVFALGLGDRLAAVTHESDFPPEAARLPTITRSTLDSHEPHSSREIHTHITAALHGGSSIYLLDQELLRRLAPDLMLTQELCDVCAVSYETVQQAVLGSSPWSGWIHRSRPAIGSRSSSVVPAAGMKWRARDIPRPRSPGVGGVRSRDHCPDAMRIHAEPNAGGVRPRHAAQRVERPACGAIRTCLCGKRVCILQSSWSPDSHRASDSGRNHPPELFRRTTPPEAWQELGE